MAEQFARIDLEEIDGGVLRRMWEKGWQTGDPADNEDFLPGRTVYALMRQAEAKGWSVTQFPDGNAQLLKGPITRVDLMVTATSVLVTQFPEGWKAHTRPTRQEELFKSLDEALSAYPQEEGWVVRRWKDGARLFKGNPQPVRDERAILRMRREFNARPMGFIDRTDGSNSRIDFAFDL